MRIPTMTFTEAAIEVLRLAGKPLHYKKITEISIQKNLLSHVGKTPEITMSSRLATMVRKDRGEAAIVKIKPGVFGLREFDEATLKAAEADSGHDFELPEGAGGKSPKAKAMGDDESNGDLAEASASGEAVEARQLPGAEVFPEEDDDDVPILSAVAEDDHGLEEGDENQPGRRKRRRRRKRREPGEAENGRPEGARAEGGRSEGGRSEGGRSEGGRSEGGRGERGRSDRGRDRGRGRGERGRPERDLELAAPVRAELEGDWDRTPEDGDLSGLELSDAIDGVLAGGRNQRPTSLADVARELVRRGRMSGGPAALAPTLAAAVRGDTARRTIDGRRPRFRLDGAMLALTDWGMPQDASRAEADVLRMAARQRMAMRRALLREMERLPAASSLELLATWLNAEGVVSLRAVRRPGSGPGEFHLAGTLRRGPMSTPVAIVFRRDGAPLAREHVVEVRGSLHHYGEAAAAWLVTLGAARSGAREEASITGSAPVALYDGEALADAMEHLGIGLTRHLVPMLSLDEELLESLRGPAAARRPAHTSEDERPARAETSSRDSSSRGEFDSAGADAPDASEEGDDDQRPRRRRRRKRGGDEGRAQAEAQTAEQTEAPEADATEADAVDPAGMEEGGDVAVAADPENETPDELVASVVDTDDDDDNAFFTDDAFLTDDANTPTDAEALGAEPDDALEASEDEPGSEGEMTTSEDELRDAVAAVAIVEE